MIITFTEKAKKHFQFLVDKYGFTINHEQVSDRSPSWEGVVQYTSRTTFVDINKEAMSGVGVGFGRLKDAKKPSLTAKIVYEYKALSSQERAIVLSFNPQDDAKASKLVQSKGLPWSGRLDDAEEELEHQLTEEARWLCQYADPFLRGDFSQWKEIFEYQIGKVRGEYARRHAGKDMVSLITKRGEDGIMHILGEKTLWDDYLEELRKEYGEQNTKDKSKLGIKDWLERVMKK
jgi:hypothetical protein